MAGGTLNKVMLIGHLGDDIKMHYFEGGNSIGRFPVATNESYTNKQTGEIISNTEWHNIVVRNRLAETCEKYLKKGDKVYCEGRIKTRQWEQEGVKRYTTEIHVTDMNFLTPKSDSNTTTTVNPQQQTSQPSNPSVSQPSEDIIDDLPF